MSDDDAKDDALVPRQAQSLANRSAALVRRGLAEALKIDKANGQRLTAEQWREVVKQVEKYLNAIKVRRNSAMHANDEAGTET